MKTLSLLLILLSFNLSASTGHEIMEKVYHVNHFLSFAKLPMEYQPKGAITLIRKSKGKKELTVHVDRYLKMNNGPKIITKEFAFFRSGKDTGTGMLMIERKNSKYRDYYYWIPALRKIRRMPEPPYEQSWGGTDFTYGDVELRKVHDETHELIGEGSLDGCLNIIEGIDATSEDLYKCMNMNKNVFIVKSVPLKETSYDYRVTYVDQEIFSDYRSLFYKNGKLVKIVEKNWASMGMPDPLANGWNFWYSKNYKTGHESMSIMKREGIYFAEESLKPSLWSFKTLRSLHR